MEEDLGKKKGRKEIMSICFWNFFFLIWLVFFSKDLFFLLVSGFVLEK